MNYFKQILSLYQRTQEQFARDLGVSLITVSRWCRGKSVPSPMAQQRIKEVIDGYEKQNQTNETNANDVNV